MSILGSKTFNHLLMKKNCIFFLLLFSTYLQAQQITITEDFGIWVGVVLKKELPQNFEIYLEQQFRTCSNTTKVDDYIADLGVSYTINKNFKLNGNFRYIHDVKKWKATENSLRYNLDLDFKTKITKRIVLSYRLRYQQKFIDVLRRKRTTINKRSTTARNKFKIAFKYKKKNQFYFSTELFINSELFRETYFDKLRFYVGDKIKTSVGNFNCALGYEVNVQPNNPFSFFFLKVIYILDL